MKSSPCFCYIALFGTLWILQLSPSTVEGLLCYTNNKKMEEVVVECDEFYNMPSANTAKTAVETYAEQDGKNSSLGANYIAELHVGLQKLSRGKFACSKNGFDKGCVFLALSVKMGCLDPKVGGPGSGESGVVDQVYALQVTNKTTFTARECYCNTDRCNDGHRHGGLSLGLLVAVVSLPFSGFHIFM